MSKKNKKFYFNELNVKQTTSDIQIVVNSNGDENMTLICSFQVAAQFVLILDAALKEMEALMETEIVPVRELQKRVEQNLNRDL